VLEVSQKCSHLIHIDSHFALPAGLRLETAAKIDKKKTEIYFSSHKKKILTENQTERAREDQTCSPRAQLTPKLLRCRNELTELARARIFAAFRRPVARLCGSKMNTARTEMMHQKRIALSILTAADQ
jgi:hypothetical protein